MISIVKDFKRAERSGNWIYNSSAHLYLQNMLRLNVSMTEYEFRAKGFFTNRRTHKFWAGVWSNMTIEQV